MAIDAIIYVLRNFRTGENLMACHAKNKTYYIIYEYYITQIDDLSLEIYNSGKDLIRTLYGNEILEFETKKITKEKI